MVDGYNISLTLGGKTILGRTQDDLTIAAVVKESITKDDAGVVQKKVVRHDISFKVSALLEVGNSTTTKMDRDDVIEYALKTGADAVLAVVYSCAGGDNYAGNAIITGYSESSSAAVDADTTISLDLQIVGAFTKQA